MEEPFQNSAIRKDITMSELRAFVGHSFTEDDKILNNTFLEYFNQIKEMGIGFTWDHAKAAEPKELAKKVMSLIRDKNLFIGICTKKERAIDPNELEHGLIKRHQLHGDESKYTWKTSDWIIQEIGLAVGREMDLILLLEEDLRPPGGLQGNIEYVPFSRDYPERSFGKILEMIRALIPRPSSASSQSFIAESSESVAPDQKVEESREWWLEPKPDWNISYYKFALKICIMKDLHDDEDKLTASFLSSSVGQGPATSAMWQCYREYYRLEAGKSGSLSKLEQFAKENSDVSEIQFYLGSAYELYKEYEKAGKSYLCAADKATDDEDRLYRLGEAARAYCAGEMNTRAKAISTLLKEEFSKSGVGEDTVVKALMEVAKIESDMEVYYGLSERLLELNPGYTDDRFNLAYRYSQGTEDKLSLFHYLKIPETERHDASWNNLGVQYNHFQMVGRAVDSYRKAADAGNTLAMSNLANKFIQAGFLTEGKEICDKALMVKDYHNNVNLSLARIHEIPDEEAKKKDALVHETIPYTDFYKAFGKAFCKINPPDSEGIWEGPKCKLDIEIRGDQFRAKGTYELPGIGFNALASLQSMGIGGPSETTRKRIINYEGTLSGYTVRASITDKPADTESATLRQTLLTGLASGTDQKVLMVISDSYSEMRVYDNNASEPERLYTLKKLTDEKL